MALGSCLRNNHIHAPSGNLTACTNYDAPRVHCLLLLHPVFIHYCCTPGSQAVYRRYTEGAWPIHINDLNCTGSEESVWECPHNGIKRYSCYHRQDASVICQGNQGYFNIVWYRLSVNLHLASFPSGESLGTRVALR